MTQAAARTQALTLGAEHGLNQFIRMQAAFHQQLRASGQYFFYGALCRGMAVRGINQGHPFQAQTMLCRHGMQPGLWANQHDLEQTLSPCLQGGSQRHIVAGMSHHTNPAVLFASLFDQAGIMTGRPSAIHGGRIQASRVIHDR